MYLIADQHHRHAPAWTVPALAARLNLPVAPLEKLVATLIAAGYLVETCEEPPQLIAAQDTATVRIAHLLDTVRAADENRFLNPAGIAPLAPVDALVARLDAGRHALLGELTLRDLLDDAGVE
jgi:membrane protein